MKEARKDIFANTARKFARGESADKEEIVEEELVLLVRAVKAVQEHTKNLDVGSQDNCLEVHSLRENNLRLDAPRGCCVPFIQA